MKSGALRYMSVAAMLGLPLAMLLAGCAGSTPIDPPPSPPAATTTPAAPATSAAPTARVALDCADLTVAAELQVGTGSAVTAVDPVVSPITALDPFAARQLGALDCAWSTGPLLLDYVVPLVLIRVVPEATSARWNEFVSALGDDAQQAGFGADSYVSCGPMGYGDGSRCELDALIDGRWLNVFVASSDSSVTVESTAPVFATATAAVGAIAQPDGERWVAPGAETSTLDAESVTAALASPTYEFEMKTIPPLFGPLWLAAVETDMTSATYSAPTLLDGVPAQFEIQVLPSGRWAFAALQAAAGDGSGIDGVGDAAVAYPSPDGTLIVFTRGVDLVLLDIYSGGFEADVNRSNALATARAVALALG